MTERQSKIQQALLRALVRVLRSPDITTEEGRRIREFALRMIAEFAVCNTEAEKKATGEDIAA